MLRYIQKLFKVLTPQQGIFLYYAVAMFIAFMLLKNPYIYEKDIHISNIDTLFVAVSALSVTGLTPVNIVDTYNQYGYVVIMIIMNLGAVGVMSIGTIVWLIFGKKISYKERKLIMVDHNQTQISGVVNMIIEIIRVILIIELVGAIIFTVYFYNDTYDIRHSLLQGIFASISATTNGGLDITGQSLIPYQDDYFILFVTMILITMGAIGYPVLLEAKQFLSNNDPLERFSLNSKISVITYFALLLIGTIGIFLLEMFHSQKLMSWHGRLVNSLFQSVTTRSGGLTTIDTSLLNEATQLFMSGLMFIGASPSSAGGGIRTTTFALMILFIIQFSRGRQAIKVFNREIDPQDIQRAFAVLVLAGTIVFTSLLFCILFENGRHDLIDLIFEVASAFGTCGLSTGITGELTDGTKIIIMMMMFIGRVGFISFIITLGGKQSTDKVRYPKERILIG